MAKIVKKTFEHHVGIVHDLTVSESHTYNVCGKAVHNSGAGSLVNYLLGITDVDPIKWGLLFSRFLNVDRAEAPDIDSDVGDRDRLIVMLRERLGTDNVIPISNVNTFALKTLVKDVSKFYGIPYEDANEATKTVDEDVKKAILKHGMDKNLFTLKFDDALEHSPSFKSFIDKHPEVAEPIAVLFKQQKALGRHAGGVLVTDRIAERMPLITSKGEAQSPWCEGLLRKDLGVLGWVKFDLLGLETLRIVQRTIELILRRHENVPTPNFGHVREWYDKHLAPDVINFDDQKVYENVYHSGKWAGIFQCLDECTEVTLADGTLKKIREMSVGDKVVSRSGTEWIEATVDAVFDNGEQDCLELEFEDGSKLVCTADHKILTHRGWIEAHKLCGDDDIVSFK